MTKTWDIKGRREFSTHIIVLHETDSRSMISHSNNDNIETQTSYIP